MTIALGQLVQVVEPSTIRHGVVVSASFPTLYVPYTGRGEQRMGVEPWFPLMADIKPRRARGPWDDVLRAAFEADPWNLRPYQGSPRQARARARRA